MVEAPLDMMPLEVFILPYDMGGTKVHCQFTCGIYVIIVNLADLFRPAPIAVPADTHPTISPYPTPATSSESMMQWTPSGSHLRHCATFHAVLSARLASRIASGTLPTRM